MLLRSFSILSGLLATTLATQGYEGQIPLHHQTSHNRKQYNKVPVALGVMSRCPDALHCENVMDSVLEIVGYNRVQISLDFIGFVNVSEPTYGVTCKHGEQECAGNIHELCVSHHAEGGLSTWWPWLQCMNMGGPEKIGKLGYAVDCAVMSGIDWVQDGIYDCVQRNPDEGIQLLKQSLEKAQLLGITKSCTIVVSGKTRCIRDDGKWYDCEGGSSPEELAATIHSEWERLNPDAPSNDHSVY